MLIDRPHRVGKHLQLRPHGCRKSSIQRPQPENILTLTVTPTICSPTFPNESKQTYDHSQPNIEHKYRLQNERRTQHSNPTKTNIKFPGPLSKRRYSTGPPPLSRGICGTSNKLHHGTTSTPKETSTSKRRHFGENRKRKKSQLTNI